MGFYSDFIVTNASGWHTFRARALTDLVGFEIVPNRAHPDGERVNLRRISDGTVIQDLLIHRNGRGGGLDLTRDMIRLRIEQVATLPDDVQAELAANELVPGGLRSVP